MAAEARAVLDLAMSEKDWQRVVVDYAKLGGWTVYHTLDSRGSEAGFPDLWMVRCGCIVVAELKTEKGQPTAEQYEWLYELQGLDLLVDSGAFLWRPSDWPEVEFWLR